MESSSYKEHSKDAYEECRCHFDTLLERVGNIKAGKVLRALKVVSMKYRTIIFFA